MRAFLAKLRAKLRPSAKLRPISTASQALREYPDIFIFLYHGVGDRQKVKFPVGVYVAVVAVASLGTTDTVDHTSTVTADQFTERIQDQQAVQEIVSDMCKLYPVLTHSPEYPNFAQELYNQLVTVFKVERVHARTELERVVQESVQRIAQEESNLTTYVTEPVPGVVQTPVPEEPKAGAKDQGTGENLSIYINYIEQLAKEGEEAVSDPEQFGPILVGAGAGELVSAGLLISLWILKRTAKYMNDRGKDNSLNEESTQGTASTIEELDRYVEASAADFKEASTLVLACILKYGKARVSEISRATNLPTETVSLLVRLLGCDHESGCYWRFANVQLPSSPPG
mgnify:CR=1 FL=1